MESLKQQKKRAKLDNINRYRIAYKQRLDETGTWSQWTRYSEIKDNGCSSRAVYALSCCNIAYNWEINSTYEEYFCGGSRCIEGSYCCLCTRSFCWCLYPIFRWAHCMRRSIGVDYGDCCLRGKDVIPNLETINKEDV